MLMYKEGKQIPQKVKTQCYLGRMSTVLGILILKLATLICASHDTGKSAKRVVRLLNDVIKANKIKCHHDAIM